MGYNLIQIAPNMEATVSRSLGLYEIEHEWFRVKRRVVHRGRLILRTMALFPGYLFLIANYMFQQIERIAGVRGFVRFGGNIEDIPESVVCALRSRAGADGCVDEGALPFRAGQPVFVRVGGTEHAGTFVEFMGPARGLVDVPMMGRSVRVRARLGEIRVLD